MSPNYVIKLKQVLDDITLLVRHGKPLLAYEFMDKLYFTINLQVERGGEENLINQLARTISDAESLLWNRIDELLTGALKINKDNATELVSYLRIIERAERLDEFYKKSFAEDPRRVYPGRSLLEWRKKGRDILRQVAVERLKSAVAPFEKRSDDWAGEATKACVNTMLEDLTHFRRLVVLFPPTWLVARTAANDYHSILRDTIADWIPVVQGNDVIRLLDFCVVVYPKFFSENFTSLGIPKLPSPILQENQILRLEKEFVANSSANMAKFLRLSLEREYAGMASDKYPEKSAAGLLKRHLPVDVRQMAGEYFDVAKLLGLCTRSPVG